MVRTLCLFAFSFLVPNLCHGQPVSIRWPSHICQGTMVSRGQALTAWHCSRGQRVGADASLIRVGGGPESIDPIQFGRWEPGPATVSVIRSGQRVTINVVLRDAGMAGYCATSWAPDHGDSGAAVIQNGRVVAVVSFRTAYRDGRLEWGGHSLVTIR